MIVPGMTGAEPCRSVYVVDDDADLSESLARMLSRKGYITCSFTDARTMLAHCAQAPCECLVTDVMMTDMDGFQLAEALRGIDPASAIVFMTAWPTASAAVDAIRRFGGLDYLEKPIDQDRLLAAIAEGVAWSKLRRSALQRLASLTGRERQVLLLLTAGLSNKLVAARLEVSAKTVEDHRAAIMGKTGAMGLADLIALVRDAGEALE